MSVQLRTRHDWYEGTFDGFDDGRERTELALALGAELTRGKARNGYAECWNFDRDGEQLAQLYGRSARAGELHFVVTGESCDEVVPIVRHLWPEHRLSRADSSVDFSTGVRGTEGAGADAEAKPRTAPGPPPPAAALGFDELDRIAVAFAEEHGVSYRLVTDSAGGATRYLGAPTSEMRVRVYKKSEQLRALHPAAAASVPDGIVRVELQVRPGKRAAKEAAARMTPDELWGLGQWTATFAERLLGFDAPRVATHFRRPSDWQRVLHTFERQWAPSVARRVQQVGVERTRSELLAALGVSE